MTKNQNLTRDVKEFLLEKGADRVGIASISRFAECPEETHPQHYIPDATCVISYGIKIIDEICDIWGEHNQSHKSAAPYLYYGYGLVNWELSRIGHLTAKRILEFHGYKALMFPPTFVLGQYRFLHRIVEEDPIFLADFSHRHAAVAAGLGEFGLSGLVLVPKYGSRIRFNSIITNAPLVADPMYNGPKLCQPEKCNHKCVCDCPTEALTLDETFTVKIGENLYKYCKAEKMRCNMAVFGLVGGTGARTRRKLPKRAKKKITIDDFFKARQRQNAFDKFFINERPLVMGDFCGKCLHGCISHKLL
ncbi:MAG: hypothetical protein ACFE8A_05835 [Candidatus Hodarchaeota archaeon]